MCRDSMENADFVKKKEKREEKTRKTCKKKKNTATLDESSYFYNYTKYGTWRTEGFWKKYFQRK